MKSYLILLAVTCYFQTIAQPPPNNSIFDGGSADGWNRSAFAQMQNNIYTGGTADGWSRSAYAQAQNNIFNGGEGDGWSRGSYQQSVNNIYVGGIGDGWSYAGYQQPVNNIYPGGIGDGWSFNAYLPAANNIYIGGAGDGWASVLRPLNILPVTFVSFTAQKQRAASLLRWETTNEVNAHSFDVERSNDAVNYQKIGAVTAAGNTTGLTKYQFVDQQPLTGYNYYRLKQIDRNGVFKHTPTRLLVFDEASLQSIKAYPVPTTQLLAVEIPPQLRTKEVVVNLTTSIGVTVQQLRLPANRADDRRVLNLAGLAAGVYTLQVFANGYQASVTVIKQ